MQSKSKSKAKGKAKSKPKASAQSAPSGSGAGATGGSTDLPSLDTSTSWGQEGGWEASRNTEGWGSLPNPQTSPTGRKRKLAPRVDDDLHTGGVDWRTFAINTEVDAYRLFEAYYSDASQSARNRLDLEFMRADKPNRSSRTEAERFIHLWWHPSRRNNPPPRPTMPNAGGRKKARTDKTPQSNTWGASSKAVAQPKVEIPQPSLYADEKVWREYHEQSGKTAPTGLGFGLDGRIDLSNLRWHRLMFLLGHAPPPEGSGGHERRQYRDDIEKYEILASSFGGVLYIFLRRPDGCPNEAQGLSFRSSPCFFVHMHRWDAMRLAGIDEDEFFSCNLCWNSGAFP